MKDLKTGEKMKKDRIFRVFELIAILNAVVFLYAYNRPVNPPPQIDYRPIYRDAIKAVDPLEYLDGTKGPENFVFY